MKALAITTAEAADETWEASGTALFCGDAAVGRIHDHERLLRVLVCQEACRGLTNEQLHQITMWRDPTATPLTAFLESFGLKAVNGEA